MSEPLDLESIERRDRMADDPDNCYDALSAFRDRRALLAEVKHLRAELAKSEAFVEHFRLLHRDWKSAFEGAKAEADRLTAELARRDQQITAVRELAHKARAGYHPAADVSAFAILRALGDEA